MTLKEEIAEIKITIEVVKKQIKLLEERILGSTGLTDDDYREIISTRKRNA